MESLVICVTWTVLSVAVAYAMTKYTNYRIAKECSSEDIGKGANSNYKFPVQSNTIVIFLVALSISVVAAFLVSIKASNYYAIIELGSCYLAVLSSAIIDAKLRIIPNFIPFVLIILRLIVVVIEFIFTDTALEYLISSLLGCFLSLVLLLIAEKISKGGIGKGDIKLLCAIGFMCGVYSVFTTLLLSLLSCIIIASIMVLRKKKNLKEQVPFGPYIYVGYSLMLLLSLY